MRFYNPSQAFYAGVDLHARSMFTQILDHEGNTSLWHGEVSGTRRFPIPLEGKRRQRRRLVGTRVGLIP